MKKILSLMIFLIVVFTLVNYTYSKINFFDSRLQVHIIDVGQGDSTLIIGPDKKTLLIDAGNNQSGPSVVSYLKSQGVRKVDVLVGTHPDSDHIGGLDDVINNFPVGQFYMPMKYHQTKTFDEVLAAASSKKLPIQSAYSGISIPFEKEVSLHILSPPKGAFYGDNNGYSAVVALQHHKNTLLFMGDAGVNNESVILSSYPDMQVKLLKLGHHGSNTSTSESFIQQLSPSAAVISAGYKNKYHHPHPSVVQLLQKENIPLYRTDEQGDIIFRSDGNRLTVNQSPGSYQRGK